MKKKQRKKEVNYNVYEWLGLWDDVCAVRDACTRCGKLFMEGEHFAVFFTGGDEISKLISGDERLSLDEVELCCECTKFWLMCLKSLGVRARYYGPERLRRSWRTG